MQLSYLMPIWLYSEPVDFRRQIDGLAILVADQLELDPLSGQLFIFHNRQRNKIKLLWHEDNGFWLCYKRLEKGRLKFPNGRHQAMQLNRDQLAWLLSGLDFTKQRCMPAPKAKYIY
jgi:transposase